MNGIKKPPTATIMDFFPVVIRLLTFVSNPTSKSKSKIPISANSFKMSFGSIKAIKLGPRIMPAVNSPITGGMLSRTATSAKNRADTKNY